MMTSSARRCCSTVPYCVEEGNWREGGKRTTGLRTKKGMLVLFMIGSNDDKLVATSKDKRTKANEKKILVVASIGNNEDSLVATSKDK
jgi:hypothetical protein